MCSTCRTSPPAWGAGPVAEPSRASRTFPAPGTALLAVPRTVNTPVASTAAGATGVTICT